MNRQQLQEATTAAKTFVASAEAAMDALNRQRVAWEAWLANHEDREPQPVKRLPSDRLDGCKESGQCKRDSLDLTRRLAELRKP